MTLHLERPWLEMDLGTPHRVLSWALSAPGYVTAARILWREVGDGDLPVDRDVAGWLRNELDARGRGHAVAMLTSRDIAAFEVAQADTDGIRARCVATVGLGNAERVGTRLGQSGQGWGTINLAVQLSRPLSDAALLEALSIATQARTAAVIDARHSLPTGLATGTGTDCIAIAAPPGDAPYAGLHTATGEVVGRAVYEAVHTGAKVWIGQRGGEDS